MSRFRNSLLPLAALLLATVNANYQANMFLNGQYQNDIKVQPETHFSVNPASNVFLHHAVISRQASPFQAPTYLPPLEQLKCGNGQQCVRQDQCQNGYYSQQLPKIQVSRHREKKRKIERGEKGRLGSDASSLLHNAHSVWFYPTFMKYMWQALDKLPATATTTTGQY